MTLGDDQDRRGHVWLDGLGAESSVTEDSVTSTIKATGRAICGQLEGFRCVVVEPQ